MKQIFVDRSTYEQRLAKTLESKALFEHGLVTADEKTRVRGAITLAMLSCLRQADDLGVGIEPHKVPGIFVVHNTSDKIETCYDGSYNNGAFSIRIRAVNSVVMSHEFFHHIQYLNGNLNMQTNFQISYTEGGAIFFERSFGQRQKYYYNDKLMTEDEIADTLKRFIAADKFRRLGILSDEILGMGSVDKRDPYIDGHNFACLAFLINGGDRAKTAQMFAKSDPLEAVRNLCLTDIGDLGRLETLSLLLRAA
ncbi:MAG: hypothetical protein KGH64_05545 [Candidatus Micrarchaeota archaeon]|nr:hypothetical protein [Candidatus Micrarchaeota archaeon]MDE1859913.1 hypothetical protein [Candidatus Micrarchaeota archaeon]